MIDYIGVDDGDTDESYIKKSRRESSINRICSAYSRRLERTLGEDSLVFFASQPATSVGEALASIERLGSKSCCGKFVKGFAVRYHAIADQNCGGHCVCPAQLTFSHPRSLYLWNRTAATVVFLTSSLLLIWSIVFSTHWLNRNTTVLLLERIF